MAALTYAAVLGLERVSGWCGGAGRRTARDGRRLGGEGLRWKLRRSLWVMACQRSTPVSDRVKAQVAPAGPSTSTWRFSGRARPECWHFRTSLHLQHMNYFFPPPPPSRFSHKLYEILFVLPTCWFFQLQCEYQERTFSLWKSQFMRRPQLYVRTLEKYTVCLLFVCVRWDECR